MYFKDVSVVFLTPLVPSGCTQKSVASKEAERENVWATPPGPPQIPGPGLCKSVLVLFLASHCFRRVGQPDERPVRQDGTTYPKQTPCLSDNEQTKCGNQRAAVGRKNQLSCGTTTGAGRRGEAEGIDRSKRWTVELNWSQRWKFYDTLKPGLLFLLVWVNLAFWWF